MITYKKGGLVNGLIKPGFFQKSLTYVVGIGLIALAFMGAQ